METDVLAGLRTILDLGWPGIVLIMLFFLWRAYQQLAERYIGDLREIAGLKASLRSLQPANEETPTEATPRKFYRASKAAK